MSVSGLWNLYGVKPASGAIIDGIVNHDFTPNDETLRHLADGAADATLITLMQQSPQHVLTTRSLATALGQIGWAGIDIPTTEATFAMYWRQMAEHGTRKSGSAHIKMTVNKGYVYGQQVEASQGSGAQFTFGLQCGWDGTNAPIISTDSNQALPADGASLELFTLGPVKINGTLLPGVQRTSVTFGIQLYLAFGDGEVWPTLITVQERSPAIVCECLDATALFDLGLTGTAQGATDSLVYFRKKLANGANVPDATAEHVSVGVAAGRISVESQRGGAGGQVVTPVRIEPVFDGVNAQLAFNTATAIT